MARPCSCDSDVPLASSFSLRTRVGRRWQMTSVLATWHSRGSRARRGRARLFANGLIVIFQLFDHLQYEYLHIFKILYIRRNFEVYFLYLLSNHGHDGRGSGGYPGVFGGAAGLVYLASFR